MPGINASTVAATHHSHFHGSGPDTAHPGLRVSNGTLDGIPREPVGLRVPHFSAGPQLRAIGNQSTHTKQMFDTIGSQQTRAAESSLVKNSSTGNSSRIDATHYFGNNRIQASLQHRKQAAEVVLTRLGVSQVLQEDILRGDHDAMGREAVVSACVQLAVTDVEGFGLKALELPALPRMPDVSVAAMQIALKSYILAVQDKGRNNGKHDWSDCAGSGLRSSPSNKALKALREAADTLRAVVDDRANGDPEQTTLGRLAALMMPGLNDIACRKQGICLSEVVKPGALMDFINTKSGAAWTELMGQWRSADTVGLFMFAGKLLHLLEEADPTVPGKNVPERPAGPPALPEHRHLPGAGVCASPIMTNGSNTNTNTIHPQDNAWIGELVKSLVEPIAKTSEQLLKMLQERGANGVGGPRGEPGLSAYELAVRNGFVGSEPEWLESLRGERGVQGERGLQGERGERGLQGEQGERGLQGERGERGLQGERGERGLQGEQGERGLQGEQGERGLQGEQGERGLQGEQGERGLQGEQGERGLQGEQGERGLQGARGADGERVHVRDISPPRRLIPDAVQDQMTPVDVEQTTESTEPFLYMNRPNIYMRKQISPGGSGVTFGTDLTVRRNNVRVAGSGTNGAGGHRKAEDIHRDAVPVTPEKSMPSKEFNHHGRGSEFQQVIINRPAPKGSE